MILEALKASAVWYFDCGYIVMFFIGFLLGMATNDRPKVWWPVAILLVGVMPLALIFIKHL